MYIYIYVYIKLVKGVNLNQRTSAPRGIAAWEQPAGGMRTLTGLTC